MLYNNFYLKCNYKEILPILRVLEGLFRSRITVNNIKTISYLTIGLLCILAKPVNGQIVNEKISVQIEKSLDNYNLAAATLQIDTFFNNIDGNNSPNKLLHGLVLKSRLEYAKGNYKNARAIINSALNLINPTTTKTQIANLLIWKSKYHIEWLELEKADSSLQIALTILEENQGIYQKISSSAFYTLGLLSIATHQYQKADSLLTKLKSNTKLKETNKLLYYHVNYLLANSKLEQELLEKADTILQSILLELKNDLGQQHYLNTYIWNHIGWVYSKQGKYKQGEIAFDNALKVCEITLTDQHPYFGKILNNFGNLYLDIGNYEEAEKHLLLSENIYKITYGESPIYAKALAPIEILYQKLGQPEKELKYALQQKEIFQKYARFSDYARTVNNLSYIYQDQKKYTEANELLEEGILRLKSEKQTKTGIYAILLMNYAGLNIDLGNYGKSEKSFEEAQQLLAEIYGKEHPWYAAVINNLASLYETTGKYQQAKKLYIETEEIDRATLGEKHPYYIHTTYNLAKINRLTQDTSEAQQHYQTANQGQIDLIYNYYSGFDEATRLDYLKKTEEGFYRFFSFALDHQQKRPTLSKAAQMVNLATKNLALDFSTDNQSLANEISDTLLVLTYQKWLGVKKQLSQGYIQSAEEQKAAGINLKKLEAQAELLEKELIRSEVISAAKLENKKRLTYEELKERISKDEAIIDFIRFPYYLPERKTDSVYYCALINRKDLKEPKMVWLGEEKQLKRLLRSNVRLNGGNYIENERIGKDLYQQIWQPLRPYLKGVKKIGISGSGLLHKVAFGALSADGQSPLIEQYNFTYYANLRGFANAPEIFQKQRSIALIGGANFDLDTMDLALIREEFPSKNIATIDTTTTESTRSAVVFNYLPGTKKEVLQIAHQFQTKKWQVQTFLEKEALEENFKELSGKTSPSVLHIATHGYFFAPLKIGRKVPDNARGRIMSAKNPLLRSGLAFSGANYAWKLGENRPNAEDGILTAYEIANQNLGNTNLVVLSACETGLGDVVNGEGVFGLQRAFKMAGVKNMLISLWKVPDQQTQELMATFYQFYLQSNDASNALYEAQLVMNAKYRPFYWGGFILAK